MARDTLTGSRIRERRVANGMRQADLARSVGISASYLNLIEHNRRRIGGKLLVDIAAILGVAPALLTEGAGAALIAGLREAAAALPEVEAEVDRVDEFAGRFPGWARLLTEARGRIAALERTVETLSDRMTHDPHLAASLHEMLSTVTAIRSAATILAEPGEIDPEWQARFHRNIYDDSARLAETSRSLVTFLEASDETAIETGNPQEEVDAVWAQAGHHLPVIEEGGTVPEALRALGAEISGPARILLKAQVTHYAADARALPLAQMAPAIKAHGPDPSVLAGVLGADVAMVMRRLAVMPPDVLPDPVGLAVCDSSGQLMFRKPLPEFPMPRVGAGCPLWPLYRALARPHVILTAKVSQAGRQGADLWCEAVAVPRSAPMVGRDPLYDALMLVRAVPRRQEAAPTEEMGSTCRICSRSACPARREPSVLTTAGRSAF